MVAFTFISQFFSIGIGYYTFSVYLKPLTEALGENRGVVSLALTLQMVLIALVAPVIGRLLSQYSLRTLMATGTLLITAGLLICANATSIWHIYLGFGVVLAVGASFTGNIPCNLILANWFVRRRGTAIGVSQTGITVSGAILVPIAGFLVDHYGWQTSFLCFALTVPVIMLPLIWKLAIQSPAEVGLTPDGDGQSAAATAAGDADSFGFLDAIRIRDVWLISLFAGPCYMAIAAVVISLPAHGTDLGLTVLQASSVVSVTTIFGAMAKPLSGIVSDYLPKKLVAAIAVVLQVVGVSLMLGADSLLSLSVAGGLFGLGYGGIAPLWSLLLAERFGTDNFAKVMGASMPITMPFNVIGLPAANFIFELTGSYTPAFAGLLVGYTIAAISVFLLQTPEDN